MFVFATVTCLKFSDFRKAGLKAVLLAMSLSVNAASAESASNQASVGEAANQLSGAELQHYKYPHWPRPQQSSREIIPPPPPGPYMSSALGDYSVKGPSFGSNPDKFGQRPNSVNRHIPAIVPMDIFSPDIPWPKNLRPGDTNSAARWMPENGYQYVKPQNNYVAPVPNRQVNRVHNYTNNFVPRMNDMRFNDARIMPLTGPPYVSPKTRVPYGPYQNVPDYTQRNYRNNSQLNMMNNQIKNRAYPPR